MTDRPELSFEEMQIAVDQLDQALEVMSQVVKRIKRGLEGLEESLRDTADAIDEAPNTQSLGWLDSSLH